MFVYTASDVFGLFCIALFLVIAAVLAAVEGLKRAWDGIRRAWATWFPANAPTWLTR